MHDICLFHSIRRRQATVWGGDQTCIGELMVNPSTSQRLYLFGHVHLKDGAHSIDAYAQSGITGPWCTQYLMDSYVQYSRKHMSTTDQWCTVHKNPTANGNAMTKSCHIPYIGIKAAGAGYMWHHLWCCYGTNAWHMHFLQYQHMTCHSIRSGIGH